MGMELGVRPGRPRKFTLKKGFRPPHFDEGDEFYRNGIFEFNVTKILAAVAAHPDRFPIEQVEVTTLIHFSPDELNEETIRGADLSKPILLAEISPGRFNVIDGNHRLERARREGVVTISAYRVRADQHLQFMTSAKAYEAYVDYWNEKVGRR